MPLGASRFSGQCHLGFHEIPQKLWGCKSIWQYHTPLEEDRAQQQQTVELLVRLLAYPHLRALGKEVARPGCDRSEQQKKVELLGGPLAYPHLHPLGKEVARPRGDRTEQQ